MTGMRQGHCSACKQPAEQSQTSTNWWHHGPPCRTRSLTTFPAVTVTAHTGGYAIGPPPDDRQPARFIPEEPYLDEETTDA